MLPVKKVVYAFIPARSGSKGLVDKNILPIDGHPLLAYAIAFGKALGIDRVILSTDSERYAEIARYYGADCPYLRGEKASSDTAMEEDILEDMEANLPGYGIPMPDIWVRLKPTNPFRKIEDALKAVKLLEERPEIDSVRHVSAAETRLCTVNDAGYLEPLLSEWPENRSVIRRTEFPKAYQVFNLDVLRHENLAKLGSAYMGKKAVPLIGEPITAFDINDADDFDMVKGLIEMRPRPSVVSRHLVEPDVPPMSL